MRKSRKTRQPQRPIYAIVADGDTEIWYLNMLIRNEPEVRVKIKPEIPNKKSLGGQYNQVCDLPKREYTKVFWMVDLDTIIKESKAVSPGKQPTLKRFIEYRDTLIKNIKNVTIIINNPCMEYWFLLNFKKTSKYYPHCLEAKKQLDKYLTGYKKTKRYFIKKDHDIYLKLKPHLKTAIRNAIALGTFDTQKPV